MVENQGGNVIADTLAEFKQSPSSVKNGLTVLVMAWLWHFVSLYYFFGYHTIPGKHIIIGISVCVFVLSLKNWGRILCIVCNILLCLEYLQTGILFYQNGQAYLGLIALMNVSLFSLATYFLMLGSSSTFFKGRMPSKEELSSNDSEE